MTNNINTKRDKAMTKKTYKVAESQIIDLNSVDLDAIDAIDSNETTYTVTEESYIEVNDSTLALLDSIIDSNN